MERGIVSPRKVILLAATFLWPAAFCPVAAAAPATPAAIPRPVPTNAIQARELPVDQTGLSNQVGLRLRSADTPVLLKGATWWTPSRVLWALGVVLAGATVTLGWGAVLKGANARLKRRVADRTEELGRSEERFRQLTACLPIGLVETNALGVCIYMNPRGMEISGREAGGPTGWAWSEAVHLDDRAEVSRSWLQAAAAAEAWCNEFRLVRPDGQICWVNCQATPRLDQLGQDSGIRRHLRGYYPAQAEARPSWSKPTKSWCSVPGWPGWRRWPPACCTTSATS